MTWELVMEYHQASLFEGYLRWDNNVLDYLLVANRVLFKKAIRDDFVPTGYVDRYDWDDDVL